METLRYKPKNKYKCFGNLLHRGTKVASLLNLIVVEGRNTSTVGGKFMIEWHNMEDEQITGELAIQANYLGPAESNTWFFSDIQLLYEGSTLAIFSLDDIMSNSTSFFSNKMQYSITNLENT